MNPLISVITPVYNTATYLNRCFDSILYQDFINIELILVNDGSTDESGTICDLYSKKDNRVKVIHTVNRGVSEARNLALNYASGEYIWFIDSDDWISVDSFSQIQKLLWNKDIDVVQIGFYLTYPLKPSKEYFKTNKCSNIVDPNSYINNGYFFGGICGSIIKNSIIKENNIKFKSNIVIGEDQLFLLTVFSHIYKVKRADLNVYHYFQYNSSSMRRISAQKVLDSLKIILDSDIDCNFKHYLLSLITNQSIHYLSLKNGSPRILNNFLNGYFISIEDITKNSVLNFNQVIFLLGYRFFKVYFLILAKIYLKIKPS